MDRIDRQLIAALAENGRGTVQALSESIGRSATAVARRQRTLEDAGVIVGYQARVDLQRLGFSTIVRIKMSLASQQREALDAFEAAIGRCPSVVQCDLMSGADDYLVTVVATSLADFARIHRDELAALPNVVRMESGFVLKQVVLPRLPPALVEGR